jgi:hypothetical protein
VIESSTGAGTGGAAGVAVVRGAGAALAPFLGTERDRLEVPLTGGDGGAGTSAGAEALAVGALGAVEGTAIGAVVASGAGAM